LRTAFEMITKRFQLDLLGVAERCSPGAGSHCRASGHAKTAWRSEVSAVVTTLLREAPSWSNVPVVWATFLDLRSWRT
jgi:hypothetical protein